MEEPVLTFIHGLKQVMIVDTSSSEDISDLSTSSRTYQVNVTDANGCSSDQTFTISEPDELLRIFFISFVSYWLL